MEEPVGRGAADYLSPKMVTGKMRARESAGTTDQMASSGEFDSPGGVGSPMGGSPMSMQHGAASPMMTHQQQQYEQQQYEQQQYYGQQVCALPHTRAPPFPSSDTNNSLPSTAQGGAAPQQYAPGSPEAWAQQQGQAAMNAYQEQQQYEQMVAQYGQAAAQQYYMQMQQQYQQPQGGSPPPKGKGSPTKRPPGKSPISPTKGGPRTGGFAGKR